MSVPTREDILNSNAPEDVKQYLLSHLDKDLDDFRGSIATKVNGEAFDTPTDAYMNYVKETGSLVYPTPPAGLIESQFPVNESAIESPTPEDSLSSDAIDSNPMDDYGHNENLDLIKNIYPLVMELQQLAADKANDQALKNWNTWLDEYKKFYGNRYQMQVEDMRKAGINPLLIGHSLAPAAGINIPAIDTFKSDTFNPQYSMTASAQVSGLYNLYSTLVKSDTDKQIAILQNELGLKQVDAQNVRTFVQAISSILGLVLGAVNPLGSMFLTKTNSIGF